jgi:hypothetical protein
MKEEYVIPFVIDNKVQGVIFITKNQYRKIKKAEEKKPIRLWVDVMKGEVDKIIK